MAIFGILRVSTECVYYIYLNTANTRFVETRRFWPRTWATATFSEGASRRVSAEAVFWQIQKKILDDSYTFFEPCVSACVSALFWFGVFHDFRFPLVIQNPQVFYFLTTTFKPDPAQRKASNSLMGPMGTNKWAKGSRQHDDDVGERLQTS